MNGMQTAFYTIGDITAIFHVGPRIARATLARHGVLPIKLGGGKTSRLLWPRDDVMRVVDILRTQARPHPQEFIAPGNNDARVIGKSASEVYAMVTQ